MSDTALLAIACFAAGIVLGFFLGVIAERADARAKV
jgi:hypothetical protein